MRDPAEVKMGPAARHGARPGSSFLVVLLAWPKRILWPNGRAHWGQKHREVSRYRDDARLLTLVELGGRAWPASAGVRVALEFRPPVATRAGRRNTATPDIDNAVAAVKSGLDGIADALGVNDRTFQLERPQLGDRVVLGEVSVRLEVLQ